MRPTKLLSSLHWRLTTKHERYKTLIDRALNENYAEADRLISHVAIDALNNWNRFCRAYFLSCVLSTQTAQGTRVVINHTQVQSVDQAIDEAIHSARPRQWMPNKVGLWRDQDEPAWHVPRYFIQSCGAVSCSNYNGIVSSFSVPTDAFEHLKVARNFYAHRNLSTLNEARSIARTYSITRTRHPTELLLTPAYNRPQVLILDWLDDIVTVSEFLCT